MKVFTARADRDVQQAVQAELACHPDVDDTDIVVAVTGGVVTLSGRARNVLHKYGAEDAVKRVAGVSAIVNEIDMTRERRNADAALARQLVTALKRVLPLCWARICPLVREGSVTLEGLVNSTYQRELAAETVQYLKDVVAVVNAIEVATPTAAPRELKAPSGASLRPAS